MKDATTARAGAPASLVYGVGGFPDDEERTCGRDSGL